MKAQTKKLKPAAKAAPKTIKKSVVASKLQPKTPGKPPAATKPAAKAIAGVKAKVAVKPVVKVMAKSKDKSPAKGTVKSAGKPTAKSAKPFKASAATKAVVRSKDNKIVSKPTNKAKPNVKASAAAKTRPVAKAPVPSHKSMKLPTRNAAATPLTVAKPPPKKLTAKPVGKAVSKTQIKAVPKTAPPAKSATKSVPKPELKSAAKAVSAPASKSLPKPDAKATGKADKAVKAEKPAKAETTAKAVKTVDAVSADKVAVAVPAVPALAKVVPASNGLPVPPPLKPGRRSSSRSFAHMPPPAPMVPTHAPDAAKASYSTMTERTVAPPPHVAAKKDPKLANNWKTKAAEMLSDDEVKAMPDAEYMNEKQLAFFRAKLSLQKQEIHNSAGATTEHLREDTAVVPDPADRATIEEEHALELRTRDRERKLLKKIEQSIGRIDSGDYGYCDETGEPIGVGRLIARPTASLSLEAQQRRELKQKMFGD